MSLDSCLIFGDNSIVCSAWLYLGESLRWNYVVSMLMILGAVALAFQTS